MEETQENIVEDVQPVDHSEESSGFPWGVMAKTLAAFSAVGGVALHMMGYISHQTYLNAWGIDPGLFPLPTDATLINGFYALLERTATMLSVIDKRIGKYLLFGFVIACYLFVVLSLNRVNKNEKATIFSFITRMPIWLADIVKSLVLTFTVLGGVPVALVFAVLIFAIPAVLGESFGHALVDRQMKEFTKGCGGNTSGDKCVELLKGKELLAYGYLIESSESHIALFDVCKKQALALARGDAELLVDQQPSSQKIKPTGVDNPKCSKEVI